MKKIEFEEKVIRINNKEILYTDIKSASYYRYGIGEPFVLQFENEKITIRRWNKEYERCYFFLKYNHILIEGEENISVIPVEVSKEEYIKYRDFVAKQMQIYVDKAKELCNKNGLKASERILEFKNGQEDMVLSSIDELGEDENFIAAVEVYVPEKPKIKTYFTFAIKNKKKNFTFHLYRDKKHYELIIAQLTKMIK